MTSERDACPVSQAAPSEAGAESTCARIATCDIPRENEAGRMPLAIRAGQAGRSYRGDAAVRR